MAKILKQRMTAKIEGDFVVFLIGMRINNFWAFNKWVPVAMKMPAMLKELSLNPESGFLGFQLSGGIPPMTVQYWRSFEHLEAYARSKDGKHFPAWVDFNKRIKKTAAVGIWHETYKVSAGNYETFYNNMPEYGLGKAGVLTPVSGKYETAAGRIKNENEK